MPLRHIIYKYQTTKTMIKHIMVLLAGLWSLTAVAQEQEYEEGKFVAVEKSYRYSVTFTDKKDCGFSVKHPEKFLSQKAIDRRKRYGLKVDEYDLPITQKYLREVGKLGLKLYNMSKWNNTAVFELKDTTKIAEVRKLPFVCDVKCVWIAPEQLPVRKKKDRAEGITNKRDTLENYYGAAAKQVSMLGVDKLHQAGYKGQGVTIAVIDGGFYNADLIRGLQGAKILGTRNFVRPDKSVYEELNHGMMVLSCIAANEPYSLVGTAPEAEFYLLQSEDGETEQVVEAYNWCAALEYADSLGCDVVTNSLGYTSFDHDFMNYKYCDQDGCTAPNSRSASLAASRGILLLNSAGNSGWDSWKRIGFPADAKDILTVGAVNKNKINAPFSSLGNTVDGRVKPDVMAVGVSSAVYGDDGAVTDANGTSFSCPIMCGAVACLVQAFPTKNPEEIIHAVQQSGDNVEYPDNVFGYGIPDMVKAMELLKQN